MQRKWWNNSCVFIQWKRVVVVTTFRLMCAILLWVFFLCDFILQSTILRFDFAKWLIFFYKVLKSMLCEHKDKAQIKRTLFLLLGSDDDKRQNQKHAIYYIDLIFTVLRMFFFSRFRVVLSVYISHQYCFSSFFAFNLSLVCGVNDFYLRFFFSGFFFDIDAWLFAEWKTMLFDRCAWILNACPRTSVQIGDLSFSAIHVFFLSNVCTKESEWNSEKEWEIKRKKNCFKNWTNAIANKGNS